jgi:hypothetical protein
MRLPKIANTTDQPIQYPNVAIGPASVVYLRHASFAYNEIPPDRPGNIIASSE